MCSDKINNSIIDKLITKLSKKKNDDFSIEKSEMYNIMEDLGYSRHDIDRALIDIENDNKLELQKKISNKIKHKKKILSALYFLIASIILFLFFLPSFFYNSESIESAIVGVLGVIGLLTGAAVGGSNDNFWGGLLIGLFAGGIIGLLITFLISNLVGQIIFIVVYIGLTIFVYLKSIQGKINEYSQKLKEKS